MKRTLFVLILALAGCHGSTRTAPPKQTDRILFSHDFHAQLEFDCDTCHKGITEATDLKTSFLPKEAACFECHTEAKENKQCDLCHKDPEHPATYQRRPQLAASVSHAAHQAAKVECKSCHTALPEADKPPVVTKADHETCLSCHDHQKAYAQASCEGCHQDMSRFAVRPVASFSHEGDFLRTHGQQAATSAATCGKCHDQTMCADCHAKTVATRVEVKFPEDVTSSFIHRGDYISRHMLDARADGETCAKCHGTSFCSSCHTANNLTASALDPRSPHPPGWAFPGSRESHGRAARNDIASCATCHDQGAQSNCVTCHAVGGVGGNPHPAGWESKHPESEIADNGMCRYCH